jgi:DNA modification methylase
VNKLYYGDNLTIMRTMPLNCVDLIYLDPPFNSQQTYNLLYKNMTGKPVPEQAEAFFDTWELDAEKEAVARSMPVLMREKGVEDTYVRFWQLWMNALRSTQPQLLAYMIYMVERLLYMKTLLRPNGSIYLHCDPAASHYIKVMMDGIFGHQNFQSEIIWKRSFAHSGARRCAPVHDTILFYTKSDTFTWNPIYQPLPQETADAWYNNVEEGTGRRFNRADLTAAGIRSGESGATWRGIDPTAKGRHWAIPRFAKDIVRDLDTLEALEALDAANRVHWPKKKGGAPMFKRYLEESKGVPLQDVWVDIPPMHNLSKDRLGYPTQKPIALLKRIIEASSNVGDVVFDPFCGCGTTIYAANELKRSWIGCDIAILAVKLIKEVLEGDRYRQAEGAHFEIDGVPVSVEQAEVLFKRDPFQFQHWLVERVGGFPMKKKVADHGIDGRLYFETRDGLCEMVLSVKGGNIRPTDLRDLRGVLEREDVAMAGFLSLREPTKAMMVEAGKAGMYEYNGVSYPRLQILTVREILEGKRELHTPTKVGARITTGQTNLPL